MLKLKQAVVVEGRYDKAKLSALIDAIIVTTDGFDVFRDREKLNYIRRLAEKDGIILLTDSDRAGFRIRSYLAGAIDPAKITHVYIPDLFGKERRKAAPSAEGKLGVEGIPDTLLLEAFRKAGISAEPSEDISTPKGRPVTSADLMEWGFAGGESSFANRQKLLKRLELPSRLNAKGLLSAINALYTYEEFCEFLKAL